jgi:hypothetical protein
MSKRHQVFFTNFFIFSSVFASTGGMVAPFIAQTSSIHPTVPIAIFGFVSVIAGIKPNAF